MNHQRVQHARANNMQRQRFIRHEEQPRFIRHEEQPRFIRHEEQPAMARRERQVKRVNSQGISEQLVERLQRAESSLRQDKLKQKRDEHRAEQLLSQ